MMLPVWGHLTGKNGSTAWLAHTRPVDGLRRPVHPLQPISVADPSNDFRCDSIAVVVQLHVVTKLSCSYIHRRWRSRTGYHRTGHA